MNDLDSPEGIEGPDRSQLEEASPSFQGGNKKPSPARIRPKRHGLDKEGGAPSVPARGLKAVPQLLMKAAQAAVHAVASAFSALAGVIGWPYVAGCLVVFLIIVLIFGGIGCEAINGYFGATLPQAAGKDNPAVKALVAAQKQKAQGSGFKADTYRLELPNKADQDFVASGKIDVRLAEALNYLVQHHQHIRVSHIVSGYQDTNINPESGAFHDEQITKNISAHRRGQAADIDEIDFVKEKCDCGDQIPVKIGWQAIGENPYGTVPDALNNVKSAEDLVNAEVRKALEEMGVTGLEQEELVAKMAAVPTLRDIKNVYDLTKPEVITALQTVGVQGIDNDELQKGLKRMHAMQQIYDLDLKDINALQNENVQKLFSEAGVPIPENVLDQVAKYQASQVLMQLKSLKDLERPEIQKALQTLGIDPANASFQEGLKKTLAAQTLKDWRGDPNDPKIQEALTTLGIKYDSAIQMAYYNYQALYNAFHDSYNLLTDPTTVAMLDAAGIKVDSPEAQKVLRIYNAGNTVLKNDLDYNNPAFWNSLENLGVEIQSGDVDQNKANAKRVVDKFRAASYMLDYHGDYTDPQFLNALNTVGIALGQEETKALSTYKAGVTLSRASRGELSLQSKEVKDALQTVKANTIGDRNAKAAINVADAKDQNDPTVVADREILGMNKAEWQTTLSKAQAARNLLRVREIGSINDPKVQQNLETLGLKDATIQKTIEAVSTVQTILSVTPKEIGKSFVKGAMLYFEINEPGLYNTIGKLGSLNQLAHVRSLEDLKAEKVQTALQNLGFNTETISTYIGKMGSVETLTHIKSPTDLVKPEVVAALTDLKIANADVQQYLGKAGSVVALTKVRQPQDLLQPDNLKALNQLGVIDLNDKLLGQVGAVQTLLQVRDLKDLMNPNSILALNQLGILSLSNPVTTALMVVVFIDNLLGGKLLGGLFGSSCKANTACYKPTAEANVHTVIGDLLQFPYDKGNPSFYRVTQLITYSEERDVLPYSAKLDSLYGAGHPPNYGLFAMPESTDHIHIGY